MIFWNGLSNLKEVFFDEKDKKKLWWYSMGYANYFSKNWKKKLKHALTCFKITKHSPRCMLKGLP